MNVVPIESYVELAKSREVYQAAKRKYEAVELLAPAVNQMLHLGVRPDEIVEVLRCVADNFEDDARGIVQPPIIDDE
jgi:hypothetical protein